MKWKTLPDIDLVNLLLHIKCHGLAIDVGCGSGADALWLANAGFNHVLAVDKNIKCILNKVKHHANIKIIKDDYNNVIKNNKFNFICSRYSTFNIRQIKIFLISLKKNGFLFLKTFTEKIAKKDLERMIQNYYYFIKEYKVMDDHSPLGVHTHNVLFVVLQKKSK